MLNDTSIYAKCNTDPSSENPKMMPHPQGSESHCRTDECGCHHPLRLWSIKYEVVGVPKYRGVAVVQAKDLYSAEMVFIQDTKFNGFREYIKIACIEEVYPDAAPCILLEDSAAIIDARNLKSYPFLLKSDYESNIKDISADVIKAVDDYIKHNPIQQVNADWNETDENSKAYILNKPEIPDAQVQADWDETDESSKAFIQNKPEIPAEQVNADWESNGGLSEILNKPKLARVATSGSYDDLVNKPEIPQATPQVQPDWNEQNDSSPAYIRNKPTSLEPIEYTGEGGVVVNNTTHVISLEDGVTVQPADPETPSNYYTFNGTKVVVPQGRGIIRLNHDYRLPSGSNPTFYDAGLYIEDPSIIPPDTAWELEYMTVMLQYPEGVPAECPLFALVTSHGNSVDVHGEYARPQQFNIPINAKGSIVQDNNINNGYPVYDEIFRNGDYCYDNLGNLYTLDNIACRFSGSTGRNGYDVSFAIVPKLQAYDTEQSTYFVRRQFQSWDYTSTEPVANEYDYCVFGSEINSQHLGCVPNNQQNYGKSYQFVSAYKSPTTGKVFYLYGTPNDTVALCCYLREMDNGNMRPAFAGFLLFGTPWSLEQPIERNQMPIEVTAFQWAESDQEIRIVDASTINGSLANIDTTAYKVNNIVVLTNTAENTTYAYTNSRNETKHISGNPDYDVIFRYCGNNKFQPIAFPIPID